MRSIWIIALAAASALNARAELDIRVDASDLPRKLVGTVIETPVAPGETNVFLYPEWIPGIHGPMNPIRNLAEVSFEADGNPIPWERDPADVYRFLVHVPEGRETIRIRTTYIAGQPTVNSRGVDTYGSPLLGAINWNTLLLYPEGPRADEIETRMELVLPHGWKWASSLKAEDGEDGPVRFAPVDLETLIDSPLLAGAHLRSIDITPEGVPAKHWLHIAAESNRALDIDPEIRGWMENTVREGHELFGTFFFHEYHYLVAAGGGVPRTGLEHLRSSFNSTSENAFIDPEVFKEDAAYLLPHEYAHSWCGKYRRPAGMLTPNYNTPKDTRLLWVYEGLDHFLGYLITFRSGIFSKQEALDELGMMVHRYLYQKGRRSIPLEDTAASAYQRRGGSPLWKTLNRAQDYYVEGLFLWLEIDGILRELTHGEVTMDDFAQRFLSVPVTAERGFTEVDIVETLNSLAEWDWAGLIENRVRGLHEELPLDFLPRAGCRLVYGPEPSDLMKKRKETLFLEASLGMRVSSGGVVSHVVPGGLADKKGMYPGIEIIGVNQRKFSPDRMRDALAESPEKRSVELLFLMGDVFKTLFLRYDGGPRYPKIELAEDGPPRILDIWELERE